MGYLSVGQMHKYLQRFPQSGHGTWGIVTNGEVWILGQRKGETVPYDAFRTHAVYGLADIESALRYVAQEPLARGVPEVGPWLDWIAEAGTPRDFVRKSVERVGEVDDAAWAQIAGGAPARGATLFDPPVDQSIWLACLRLDFPDGLLSAQDIADRVSELQDAEGLAGSILGTAFSDTGRDGQRRCRGFVWTGDALAATALLDPVLPGSRGPAPIHRARQTCYRYYSRGRRGSYSPSVRCAFRATAPQAIP